ncbi:hypothetical protein DUNSADRAFT_16064 [Dunaliella salina]|uniref:Exonuclease domain-containing protein n=1 Tax=Dunaliella salina TaxID=3046 RepID=A0ABQ7G4B5_DUNSA|nr:hypothetical protein DUNSADRAFT_16064 [Dunaliella salina]|eukprot:KAF5829453.1 hypothetical protein DUNSADRAFT_16064 [Dunaliella salina]
MAKKKNQKSKGQKRKQQQKQQKPKKRELIDPNAGPDGLGVSQLQNLVRAAQRHQVGDWQGFIKSVAPRQKKTDPAAHTEEVLRAFVKHLQEGPNATNPTSGGNKGTQPISSATFVQRYVKWAHQLQKEQILKATSVVPPSVIKALSPAPAAPPSTSGSGTPGAGLDDGGAERLTSPWGLVHASRNHPRHEGAECLPKAAIVLALVRPRGNIVNLRTELTGITTEDLDTKPTVSRTQARKRVKALLLESWRAHKQPTILVGHALHHDLLALRLDHQPVIDTSLIFSYRGLPACTPGLYDLSQIVLHQDMPARGQGRHDSVEDATVSMRLVMHELARQQRTEPLEPPEIKVDKEELCKLLVHSIPKSATEKDVLALFAPQQDKAPAADAAPAPSTSAASAGAGGQGKGTKGSAEASSDDDEDEDEDSEEEDEEGPSSSSGSSSSEDESSDSSDSDSSDSDEEPPKKKQQKTLEQGTPNQQGAASSSDSSDSESSDSSSEEEEDDGGSEQPKDKKKQSSAADGKGGAASASGSGNQIPQPIGFEGGGIENRRAVLLFCSPGDANTAFNSLAGTTDTDSNGRQTKEVPLPGDPAKSLRIRRMAAHNGLLFQVPKQARRPRPQKGAKELPTVGENGQPLTKREKYRLRELMVKKGKTPQDLKKAAEKYARARVRREKKKQRKAATKEAKQAKKIAVHTAGGIKMKRQRPFKKKTPEEKAAAHEAAVAAVAAGAAPPQGGGKQKKVTQKDLKKAAKKAAKAQKKQKGGTPNKPSE